MSDKGKTSRDELRKLLRAKIGEKQIQRSTKTNKEHVMDKTLKSIGIDKEKFKKDLELIQQNGGFEMKIN